jgi:hypothetical protein
MNKYSLITYCIILLYSLPLDARNDFSSTGYSSGAAVYLNRPVHAHAAALGRAVTAWDDELAGVQYNPAVLDRADGIHIAGSYTLFRRDEDRRLYGFSGAVPIGGYCVLGASFRTFGVDNIERRNEEKILLGTFEDKEIAAEVAVAGRFPFSISSGIRFRYLNQHYTETHNGGANGMGFDAGVLWAPIKHISIGLSGLNIGSYLWWNTGHRDIVLPQVRGGIAGIVFNKSLIVELDILTTLNQPTEISSGVQYTLFEIISARAGVSTSIDIPTRHSRNPDISAGVGIRHSFFGCDYALVIPTDNAREMLVNKFSLILRFNQP